MLNIRPANPNDLEALYDVSLKTGHLGEDASSLYADPKMMGHIYSAPYLMLDPELAFVAESRDGVVGFCVGTADTSDFEARLEREWWPALRQKYSKPNEETRSAWTADERRRQMIHVPETTPLPVAGSYPAHLHMNLLPVAQGRKLGGRLLEYWLSKAAPIGVTAVHIGSNSNNTRANQFWHNHGFIDIPGPKSRTRWMGRTLT
ncbi:GNAT family N-acetyltransferase [Phaeobacter sp. C3_T13_0]|uniref:GNAT family N-acetyltransferase n=1 Tax=Phaeobacter cretensis TaxID=3342641 RepID=UPI0039BD3629